MAVDIPGGVPPVDVTSRHVDLDHPLERQAHQHLRRRRPPGHGVRVHVGDVEDEIAAGVLGQDPEEVAEVHAPGDERA